jgi:hypothetical protein
MVCGIASRFLITNGGSDFQTFWTFRKVSFGFGCRVKALFSPFLNRLYLQSFPILWPHSEHLG